MLARLMTSNENLIRSASIVFDLPFRLNLPDGRYEVNSQDCLTSVYLKSKISPSDMPGMPAGFGFAPGSVVLGDRWGKFSHTNVQMVFHYLFWIKPSIVFPHFLLSKATDIINRMFSVCRGVRGDHYTRITKNDIFSFNVYYFDTYGNPRPEVSVPFGTNTIAMGGASNPTNEELTNMRQFLSSDFHLPLFQEVILDAWDYHYYGNYRAAVVESGTAFEVFIHDFIWNAYLKKGKSEDIIKKILEAGLMNLLRDHIIKLTGDDFCSTQEYSNWQHDAYDIRNDTVHRGKKISENESFKAIQAVSDAVKFILSMGLL
jgi:hypothetical protein